MVGETTFPSGSKFKNFILLLQLIFENFILFSETTCHERTSPSGSKFEHFILLSQLIFELEQFKPPAGSSVFWLGNPYHVTDCPRFCTKVVPYVFRLNSKFKVSKISRFKSYSDFGLYLRNVSNFSRFEAFLLSHFDR